MVTIKSEREIELMRHAGQILGNTLKLLEENVKPGITTAELDKIAYEYIKSNDSIPSFKGYNGFPASICASVNNEVVHGIPDNRVLREGDIIGIDAGVCFGGYHADAARTFGVGEISPAAKKLIEVTKESFFKGIENAKHGARIGDISAAVQTFVEGNGYSVVRDLIGHGIGSSLHEEPDVPNYGSSGRGMRLIKGMTLAVEPMVNVGGYEIRLLKNGWTYVTKDNTLSAHYENTIVITDSGCDVITLI
ncbi:MAG: type I methionyl aminopeptidase [Clostridia bacterium]|nr:type I methionyl aminopeptidase [Clostridia bacterium]